mmetsp:Transcript_35423/g.82269  ORF Transcript_35423/g.82269 Transcript_35423/m.82269 type:complete len:1087 (+) Transcript_35423:154-3414(+)
MHIKIGTTADGFEDWSIGIDVQQGTTAAQLKELLASPPHGLPVTTTTKVLKRQGATLMSLANTDKVSKDLVLLNVEPGPRPTKPDFSPKVQDSRGPVPAISTVPVRVTVRTTASGFENWKVEVDVLPSTTVTQLREILTRAPHSLQLTLDHQAMRRGKPSQDLTGVHEHEPVPPELIYTNYIPQERVVGMSLQEPPGAHRHTEQVEYTRLLTDEEKGFLFKRVEEERVAHGNMWPRDRRGCSWPRVMAYATGILQMQGMARRGTKRRPFVFWILGASNEVEVHLAERGYFHDANFLDRQPCEVILMGDDNRGFQLGAEEPTDGEPPRIRSINWSFLPHWRDIPRPDINVILAEGDAMSKWISQKPKAQQIAINRFLAPTTLLTLRARMPDDLAQAVMQTLGDRIVLPVSRNIFSSLSGEATAEYDDNGWFLGFRGLETIVEVVSLIAQHRERGDVIHSDEHDDRAKITATFWGIIDLKYDPSKSIEERVKVLETGDGRSSRFSHAGAIIPKRFKEKYKLDEGANSGKHAVVSANKKLTHDLMELYGYGHLVPRQVCFPRVYDLGLADRIIGELGVSAEDLVVLKLCNRSRAAGVLPVPAGGLDSVLKEILQLPPNFEDWMQRKLKKGTAETLEVDWGCYEEQLRHWWSNECPHFVVEQFCTSILTRVNEKEYDGTMRIAFAISRKHADARKSRSDTGSPKSDYSNPLLEFTPPAEELEVEWIGGYWKLPKEDVESVNIRASVISAARTAGTAHVDPVHLAEVYAAMGDSVQQLFGGCEPSPKMLTEKYNEQPELATYLTARLAIAMRDLSRVRMALKLASQVVVKAPEGPAKRSAESFVNRGYGILEAMTPPYKWSAAREYFEESVRQLPSNAAALYQLGMAELELGKTEEAVILMEKSLLLDLDFKAPYVNLGVAYLRLRKFDLAIAVSEACLKRHPESPQCHYHIGVAYYQKAQQLETTLHLRQPGKAQEVADAKLRAINELMESRESEEGQRLVYRGIRGGPGKSDSPWLDADDEMVDALKRVRSTTANPARLPVVQLPDNVGGGGAGRPRCHVEPLFCTELNEAAPEVSGVHSATCQGAAHR